MYNVFLYIFIYTYIVYVLYFIYMIINEEQIPNAARLCVSKVKIDLPIKFK